jgi:nitrate reductase gamma subunit
VWGNGGKLETLAQVTAWVAVVAGLVGALGVVAMRLVNDRLRPFTSRGQLLNLGVIAAIFATGLAGLLLDRGMVASMIGVVGALAGRGEMPVLTGAALAHVGVVAVFLAYFPFTQMTHLYMKYFTYHEVRWDDAPSVWDPRTERDIAKSLEQGVSWTGTHIGSNGTKSWAEIVAPKGSDVEQKP